MPADNNQLFARLQREDWDKLGATALARELMNILSNLPQPSAFTYATLVSDNITYADHPFLSEADDRFLVTLLDGSQLRLPPLRVPADTSLLGAYPDDRNQLPIQVPLVKTPGGQYAILCAAFDTPTLNGFDTLPP